MRFLLYGLLFLVQYILLGICNLHAKYIWWRYQMTVDTYEELRWNQRCAKQPNAADQLLKIMTLRTAAKNLHEQLKDDPNLVSVGSDEMGTIYVYTKEHIKNYPNVYEDFPVVVKKIGQLVV